MAALLLAAIVFLRYQLSRPIPDHLQNLGNDVMLPLVSILLLVLIGLVRVWKERSKVSPLLKVTHLLPSVLQVIIFSYWFLHWPAGRDLIPLIALTTLLALPIDAALSAIVNGSWRPNFGFIPVALSTNLVAQFFVGTWWVGMLAVAVAIASKHLIRRNGRHVFNPSAFGLCVVAVLDLSLGETIGPPDFAAEFSLAPLMAELILVLALIVQLRLRLVLVTISATLALYLLPAIFPFDDSFGVVWPPVLLIIVLLITDPSTIPREPLAQVAFGVLIAIGMQLTQAALFGSGHSDFWAKVAVVPLANALVPRLDALAKKVGPRRGLNHELNRRYVLGWVTFALMLLYREPRWGNFEHASEESIGSPCYTPAPEEERCRVNTLFCQPLRIDEELSCWLTGQPPGR